MIGKIKFVIGGVDLFQYGGQSDQYLVFLFVILLMLYVLVGYQYSGIFVEKLCQFVDFICFNVVDCCCLFSGFCYVVVFVGQIVGKNIVVVGVVGKKCIILLVIFYQCMGDFQYQCDVGVYMWCDLFY